MTDLPPIVCGKSLIVIFLVFFRADLMFLELTGSIVLNCLRLDLTSGKASVFFLRG